MSKRFPRAAVKALAIISLLLAAGCESSEKVAPDGSTLELTATPNQIIQDANNNQIVDVDVIATVRNKIGVPLPDQAVRFHASSGELFLPGTSTEVSSQPVPTDDVGNATVVLKNAITTTTVNATAGKATASINIQAAKGTIKSVTISPLHPDFMTCNDTQTLTITVLDIDDMPVSGVQVQVVILSSTSPVTGTFDPNPVVTNSMGVATTDLSLTPSDCSMKCQSNKSCTLSFQAQAGVITSLVGDITDSIP